MACNNLSGQHILSNNCWNLRIRLVCIMDSSVESQYLLCLDFFVNMILCMIMLITWKNLYTVLSLSSNTIRSFNVFENRFDRVPNHSSP